MSEKVNKEIEKDTQKPVEKLKTVEKVEVKSVEVAPKRTMCRLVSKADYIIRVTHNGQALFIQPYGWAKVIKEQVTFDRNDARYLTFVKL